MSLIIPLIGFLILRSKFNVFNSAAILGVEITQQISMLNIAIKMFFVVTVPVLLGMIVKL